MKKLKEFLKKNKYAIIWTACYIVVMFLVLLLMFGFNMFSMHDWSILARARLHGFPGFVFGILILAAIPLYIATTAIIIRTGKPLFVLVAPKPIDKKEDKPVSTPVEIDKPLSPEIPSELRGAFLRARKTVGMRAVSDFEMKDNTADAIIQVEPEPVTVPAGLPIPDDFDFGASDKSDVTATPVFKEISFGSINTDSTTDEKSELHKHLESKNYAVKLDGNITISNGMAIVTHDDSDFWIADDDNWFAAGKQKKSPIAEALAAAATHNIEPAVYLAETNIMDLESKTHDWESRGIRVIKKLSDI